MPKPKNDPAADTATSTATSGAATQPTQAGGDGQLVHLCDASRRELFMLETPNQGFGRCERCDAVSTVFQYPRAEVRMEHLSAQDRDAFNAKLDVLAAAAATAKQLQDAADAAAAKRAEDQHSALVADNDAKYQAAIDARRAIEAAESGAGGQAPPAIIQSPATPSA